MKNNSMKLIITLCVLFNSMLYSVTSTAACSSFVNHNANITTSKPDNIYEDNMDGTVTDTNTNLMWQKCTLGLSGSDCNAGTVALHTWQSALKLANVSTDFGYSDWRLPNKNELLSLLEDSCFNPAINTVLFPNTDDVNHYWTSTTSVIDNKAWSVLFYDGFTSEQDKNITGIVRLVRGSL